MLQRICRETDIAARSRDWVVFYNDASSSWQAEMLNV